MAGLNPVACILAATALSVVIACLASIKASCLSLLLGMALLCLSRPHWRNIGKKLYAVNFFILFIWLVVPFSTEGKIIWQWGFLHLTETGIRLSLLVSLRANAIACIFLALVAPLSFGSLASGLQGLHCPAKLALIFLLMGRNIFILKREWQLLTEAARLRGFVAATNMRTYSTAASMLALLVIRANARGARMHEAMLLRGFSGVFFGGYHPEYHKKDIFFALFAMLGICMIILAEYL